MRFTDAFKPQNPDATGGGDFFAELDGILDRAERGFAGVEADRLDSRSAIRAQVRTAAPAPAPAQLGYNPQTQEFYVGGQIVPADVSAIKALAEMEDLPDVGEVPEGFLRITQDRIRQRNQYLRDNMESDLFSTSRLTGMVEATLGGLTTGVGNLLGQDWENPMAGATAAQRRREQTPFEQYGMLERPTESLTGAINALGSAVETGLPTIGTGLVVGGVTANPLAGLAAAGAVGGSMAAADAGSETRDRLSQLVAETPDAELLQANETYATLRTTLPEEDAKAELVRRGVFASSWSAGGIAALSSAAGVGLARLIPKGALSQPTDALSRLLRGRDATGQIRSGLFPAARAVAGGTALTGLGEGTSEFLERDLSQNAGDIAAGLRTAALGKYGTVDDFAAGFIGGAALGAPASYTSSSALRGRDPTQPAAPPPDAANPEDLARRLRSELFAGSQIPADAVTPQDVLARGPELEQRRVMGEAMGATPQGQTVAMPGVGAPQPEAAPPSEQPLPTVEEIDSIIRAGQVEAQQLRTAGNENGALEIETQIGELQALRESLLTQPQDGQLFDATGAPDPVLARTNEEARGQQLFDEDLSARRAEIEARRAARNRSPGITPAPALPAPAPTGDDGSVRAEAEAELSQIRQLLAGQQSLPRPNPNLVAALEQRASELEPLLTGLPLQGGAVVPVQAPRINLRLAARQAAARGDRPTAEMVAAVAPTPAEPAQAQMDPGPPLFTPGGRPSQAARAATGNQTLAEGQASIDAQVAEMMDPAAGRDAVWVSRNPDGTPAPQPSAVPPGVIRVDTPAGTLYTTNRSKAAGLRRNPNRARDPAFVSDLIGFYTETKPEVARAAARGEPVVSVVTETPEGTQTATTLVTPKNLKRQVAATAAATGKAPKVETPAETLKKRAVAARSAGPVGVIATAPKAAEVKAKAKPKQVPEAQRPGPVKSMTRRQYLERKIEEATDVDEIARLQQELDNLGSEDAGRSPGKESPRRAEEGTTRRREVDPEVEKEVAEALAEERDGDVEVGLLDEPAPTRKSAAPAEETFVGATTLEVDPKRPHPLLTRLKEIAAAVKPTLQVGRVRVYTKDDGKFERSVAQIVNEWARDFMPKNSKTTPGQILVVEMEGVRDPVLSQWFGGPGHTLSMLRDADGRSVSVIAVNSRIIREISNELKVPFENMYMEILAHEFGHLIERETFHALSPEDQSAVMGAFEQWRAQFPRGPRGAAAAWANRTGPVYRRSFKPGDPVAVENVDYARAYKEWTADNIGRALMKIALDQKPQGAVQQFFNSVAKKIRTLWQSLTKTDNPDATIMRVLHEQMARVAKANADGAELTGNYDGYAAATAALDNDLGPLQINDFKKAQKTVDDAVFDAEAELDRAAEQQNALGYNVGAALADALRADGTLRDKLRGAKRAVLQSKIGDRALQLQAALMTQWQMVQKFEGMGEAAREFAGWLRRNVVANAVVESTASKARAEFEQAFEKAALLDGRYRAWLMQIMHDATMLDMHPDEEFTSGANKHLRVTPDTRLIEIRREQHARLRAKFELLRERSPEAAELYTKLRDEAINLSRKIAQTQIRDLLKEIEAKLDFTGEGGMAMRHLMAQIRLGELDADAQATFDALPAKPKGAIKALRGQIAQIRTQKLESNRGPWFPLRRRGEYIVKVPLPEGIVRDSDNELFKTYDQAKRAADRAKANNPSDNARVNAVKDDDGKTIGYDVRVSKNGVFFFESEGAALAAVDDMKATVERLWMDQNIDAAAVRAMLDEMPESTWQPKRVSDMYTADKVVPAAVLEQLKNLREEGLPEHLYQHFQRMALEADAHYTLSASALPRRNVIGASEDMLTALGEWVYGASYNLGMLDQANEIATSWTNLKKLAKNDTEKTIFLNALNKNNLLTRQRRELTGANEVANALTRISSLFSLAFSPAYVALNATQPHIVGTPLLAGKIGRNGQQLGLVEAQKYILDAMKGNASAGQSGFGLAMKNGGREFMQQLRSLAGKGGPTENTPEAMFQQVLDVYARNPTERALLTTLRDQGTLDFGHLAAMQDVMAQSVVGAKFNNISRMGMAFAQHMETMNRVVSALAAYRAATEKLGYDPVLDVDGEALALRASDGALSFTSDFLNESMVNYSMFNRPNVFKYQWMGPLLQFKMYTQGIYSMFIRHAAMAVSSDPTKRKQGIDTLRGLFASHALFGGFLGLGPVAAAAQVAIWALTAAFGDDEERWKDRETLSSELIREYLGDGFVGTAFERGLPAALLGADMSGRIGIPNLIDTRFMGIRESASGTDNFDAVATSLAGPVYSNLRRAIVGSFSTVGEFADWAQGESTGDDVLRELGRATPSGLRAVVDAARYMTSGVTEGDGDRIIGADEISTYETFIRAMGITPTQVTKVYDQRRREFDTLARIESERTDILRAYAGAQNADDRLRARQRIRDFNRIAPPELQIQPSSAERARGSRAERDAGKIDSRRQAVRDYLEG